MLGARQHRLGLCNGGDVQERELEVGRHDRWLLGKILRHRRGVVIAAERTGGDVQKHELEVSRHDWQLPVKKIFKHRWGVVVAAQRTGSQPQSVQRAHLKAHGLQRGKLRNMCGRKVDVRQSFVSSSHSFPHLHSPQCKQEGYLWACIISAGGCAATNMTVWGRCAATNIQH
eukprot:scaffold131521_cov19-Tisochrysis_lutea.AAC.1